MSVMFICDGCDVRALTTLSCDGSPVPVRGWAQYRLTDYGGDGFRVHACTNSACREKVHELTAAPQPLPY